MKVGLTHRAANDLDRLRRSQLRLFEKMATALASLEEGPKAGKQLVGPLKGKWSLRVGAYRAIYQVEKNEVVILTVNHRGEVYR